jgi:hypothetical protein
VAAAWVAAGKRCGMGRLRRCRPRPAQAPTTPCHRSRKWAHAGSGGLLAVAIRTTPCHGELSSRAHHRPPSSSGTRMNLRKPPSAHCGAAPTHRPASAGGSSHGVFAGCHARGEPIGRDDPEGPLSTASHSRPKFHGRPNRRNRQRNAKSEPRAGCDLLWSPWCLVTYCSPEVGL